MPALSRPRALNLPSAQLLLDVTVRSDTFRFCHSFFFMKFVLKLLLVLPRVVAALAEYVRVRGNQRARDK